MTLKIKDKIEQGFEHCRLFGEGCISCPYHITNDGEIVPAPNCFNTLMTDMKKVMDNYEMQINMLSEALEEYEHAEFEKPKVKSIRFEPDSIYIEDVPYHTFTFEMDKLGEIRDE